MSFKKGFFSEKNHHLRGEINHFEQIKLSHDDFLMTTWEREKNGTTNSAAMTCLEFPATLSLKNQKLHTSSTLLDSQKSNTTVLTLLCTGRDHFHKRQAVFDFENFSPTKCDDNYFFHHHCIGRRIGQGILEKPPWISKMGLKSFLSPIWIFINLKLVPGGQKMVSVCLL